MTIVYLKSGELGRFYYAVLLVVCITTSTVRLQVTLYVCWSVLIVSGRQA